MARRRSPSELDRDRRRVAELYLQGQTQHEIAAVLNVAQSTISNELKAIRKLWRKSALVDFNEKIDRELAKIDLVEQTFWQAWLASCEDVEQTTMSGGADGPAQVVRKTVKGKGNTACLTGILSCVDRRCKLLGLDAPKLMAVVDEDFDREAWEAGRAARQASAMAILEESEE